MDQRENDEPQNPQADQPVRRRGTQPQESTQQQAWGQPQPGYGPPAGYTAPPPAPAPKKKGKFGLSWRSLVILLVGILIGVGIGSAGKTSTATVAPVAGASTAAVGGNTTAAAPAAVATTPPPAAPAKTVVLQKSGEGSLGTKSFTVGDDWSLTYTFDCSSNGGEGNFQVYEDYPNGAALVNALAKTGSDVTYQHGDAGTHSLEINSECKWSITATDGDG